MSLYIDIFTPDIRLMCLVCMEKTVHKILDSGLASVYTHLYTSYQTDLWSL
jgi:hypothetical protein